MKTALLILAALALTLVVAEPVSATCVIHRETIDPVKKDTGTPLDAVVVTYSYPECNPIPP